METLLDGIGWLDQHSAAVILPVISSLAIYLLLSGLDDFVLDLLWLSGRKRQPSPAPVAAGPEKRIAILLPLWQESGVVERMLDHNLARIRYRNFEILAGVYPNDAETREAVERAAARHPQVRISLVPHDGPTSKADCLNWIFQRLIELEKQGAPAAEVVLIHDAEDLIHPDELALASRLAGRADMVQVPVLALPTPLHELTHGVYCDDFAEGQHKDLATRAAVGGFLPGCGVGTAFRREALEGLAEAESNRLFDPFALTEDYDNGLRLYELGCRQVFVPLQWKDGEPLATREYFPRSFRAAVRQRTRWLTGNCLQAWQRHGWGRGMRRPWLQAWFFWRDRKVLWGSWIGLLSNLVFLWALTGWAAARTAPARWFLGGAIADHPWLGLLLSANLAFCCERLAVRMYCSSRVYGWLFAAGVPLRMVWGNLINAAAALRAVWQFSRSQWTGKPLRWLKTEHCYPSLENLSPVPERAFARAVGAAAGAAQPRGSGAEQPKSHHLRVAPSQGAFAVESTTRAGPDTILSAPVHRRILRALPARLCDELSVAPVRVEAGRLEVVATGEISPAHQRRIASYAGLPVRVLRSSPDTLRQLMQERDAPPQRTQPSQAGPRPQPPALPGQRLQPAQPGRPAGA